MQSFLDVVWRVVPTDSSLLILGETGVGKERLARAIHNDGPRSQMPFVAVNCAALPEALLESELFGHETGAFTGADRPRRGYFELAHKGTIFLDEVCELPVHLQAKLLQVLQNRTLRPVGSEKLVEIDVRVVAATNREIEEELEARRFREDLYYRLSVVTLRIPALRDRCKDIPLLLESCLEHFCRRLGRKVAGFTAEAAAAVAAYTWPGNVRELINAVERAVLLCNGEEIALHDLPEPVAAHFRQEGRHAPPGGSRGAAAGAEPRSRDIPPWRAARAEMLATFERDYFARLLALTRGRINDAAHYAGMAPRSLLDKLKRHGLRKEDFKAPAPRRLGVQAGPPPAAEGS